jgi:hypothetical protein
MSMILEGNGVLNLDIALEHAHSADPRVLMVCHTPGHKLAEDAYRKIAAGSDERAVERVSELFQLPANGCHGSMVHGMLEGWAYTQPTAESFTEFVKACERRTPEFPGGPGDLEQQYLSKVGRCADSLGHAVWNVWQDPSRCSEFTVASARITCGSGVIMQMYQPSGSPSPNLNLEYSALLDLCNSWPASLELEGCNVGVAFAFQRPFSDRIAQLTQDRVSAVEFTAEERDSAYAALDESIALCRGLHNDPGHTCESAIVVTEPLMTLPRTLVASFCDRLHELAAPSCRAYNRLD